MEITMVNGEQRPGAFTFLTFGAMLLLAILILSRYEWGTG